MTVTLFILCHIEILSGEDQITKPNFFFFFFYLDIILHHVEKNGGMGMITNLKDGWSTKGKVC